MNKDPDWLRAFKIFLLVVLFGWIAVGALLIYLGIG